jgi:cytochrome c-type biogenesis protein CcmH
LFVLIAVGMVAIALAAVLIPLLRGSTPGVLREATNVAILRDQLRELDADLDAGTMPRDRYDQAKQELLQRALEESKSVEAVAAKAPQSAAWTAAVLGSTLPIAALLLYLALGNHDAFAPLAVQSKPAGEHKVTRQDIEALAEKLAAKLKDDPANVDGWVMLARTYQALDRNEDSARAFDRAVALLPDNADLLADYADLLATIDGGFREKSVQLVEQALKADPRHWKALALAGTAAFNRKDYKTAVGYWERMKATVPPTSPLAGSIDASIAEARELGGLKARGGTRGSPACNAGRTSGRHCGVGRRQDRGNGAACAGPCGQSVADRHRLHFRARGRRPADAARHSEETGEGSAGHVCARRFDGNDAQPGAVELPFGRRGRARVEIGKRDAAERRPRGPVVRGQARRDGSRCRHRPHAALGRAGGDAGR